MAKAWAYDARRLWVLNVGDLKPAEIDIEFFLRLAWNPKRWTPEDGQTAFFRSMIARDFGASESEEIASMLNEYYRLNFQRKPEHMGIDLTSSLLTPLPGYSHFTPAEARMRLASFAALVARADGMAQRLAPNQRGAYFELIQYPIDAAALMNLKGLSLSAYYALNAEKDPRAEKYLAEAVKAQAAVDAATAYYNNQVADGKWRGIMSDAPRGLPVFGLPSAASFVPVQAENDWQEDPPGVRLSAFRLGSEMPARGASPAEGFSLVLAAAETSQRVETKLGAWRTIGGLGYTGKAVEVWPTTARVPPDAARIRAEAPSLRYQIDLPTAGKWQLTIRRIPTWAVIGDSIRYAVSFDDGPIQIVDCQPYRDESDRSWQRDVLRNASYSTTPHNLGSGRHRLEIWAVDPGLVIDSVEISHDRRDSAYAWPRAPSAPLAR
jgi:hypothetical protein